MLRLKSRQLWLKEGDKNSRFFHNSIKDRQRKGAISVLEGAEGRVEGFEEVKKEVRDHFEGFFKEENHDRAVPKGLDFRSLTKEDREWLERPFSEEEIKTAVWDCDGNKSPGPDGFTLEFFQQCWETLKADVVRYVTDFFDKAKLTKGCISSFITLIPKVKHPIKLTEYRPICLVGSLYKIISKLLAGRMKSVLGKLVSKNQTAFVPGRNIAGGVLVVNEVLDLAKRKKRRCLVIKVDFEKAYDRVSWSFLRFVLIKMGFGARWLRWMEGCVFTSSLSVIINGSVTKDFKVEKGLRQGDLLSPFLFVLATEVLTGLMEKAISLGEFRGFMIKDQEAISMLQFADDTIILAEGDLANIWSIKSILRGFEIMSGLRVNFNKSNIFGVNVGDWFIEATSTFLVCKVDKLSFKFLAPTKVLNEIRSIQSSFLWNGSEDKRTIHWVRWDTVCKERDEGGLGVKNVEVVNLALLSKWKWRILTDEEAVWRGILISRYGDVKRKVLVGDVSVTEKAGSIWWRDLLLSDNYLSFLTHNFAGAIFCKIGSGTDTPFWHGCWAAQQSLVAAFPELFVVAGSDILSVAEAGVFNSHGWTWNDSVIFDTQASVDNDLRIELQQLIQNFAPCDNAADVFHWTPSTDGEFSVKSCYKRFFEKLSGPPLDPNIVKAAALLWKEENLSHLLGGCEVVKGVWAKVFKWIGTIDDLSYKDFVRYPFAMHKVKGSVVRDTVALFKGNFATFGGLGILGRESDDKELLLAILESIRATVKLILY
ncbi:uncharacterized protein LOC131659071 [Vicia villosa]|uniref:uncharacterized protein LOC131659071 n=1 Tax=Vicia villosa TaxID=3911 RepID=UPI00273A8075|nr:uncharacterized protein LOC131659071 [Vicia villosa]